MPKRTKGTRWGSKKHRDFWADEEDFSDSRSSHEIENNQSPAKDAQNPAEKLASNNGALQRLANIAQLFASFSDDVQRVETAYRTELDQENEIKSLNRTLDTLRHERKQETDNLRRENDEFKANQIACEDERREYQTIRQDYEDRYAQAEAEQEKTFKSQLEEEKLKCQKALKVKAAKIEDESRDKLKDLETQNESLRFKNEELEKKMSDEKEKWKTNKSRYTRNEKVLNDDIKRLQDYLKQIKSDFPISRQPVEFYTKKFGAIYEAIKVISTSHFQELPERAQEDTLAFHEEIIKLNPMFSSTSISQTEASTFMRFKIVQYVISANLCDLVWQQFFLWHSPLNNDAVRSFMEEVSGSLSQLGGKREAAWRALTLQGIDGLDVRSSQAEPVLHSITKVLRPLVISSHWADFETDLLQIINDSITLRGVAHRDELKISIERRPDPDDKEKWQAEDISDAVGAPVRSDGDNDMKDLSPLCLFPNILQKDPKGEMVIVHQGSALLPTSHAWTQAMIEKKEHEEEWAKAMSEARSKFHARNMSCSTEVNGPVEGKRL